MQTAVHCGLAGSGIAYTTLPATMMPASRKARNVALNKALKSLAPTPSDYAAFRQLAQSYVAGQTSAATLADAFFNLYPAHHHDLFAEMASLLPNSALSNDLLAAAGHYHAASRPDQPAQPATGAPQPPPRAAAPVVRHPPPPADVPIPDWILHDGVAPNSNSTRYFSHGWCCAGRCHRATGTRHAIHAQHTPQASTRRPPRCGPAQHAAACLEHPQRRRVAATGPAAP